MPVSDLKARAMDQQTLDSLLARADSVLGESSGPSPRSSALVAALSEVNDLKAQLAASQRKHDNPFARAPDITQAQLDCELDLCFETCSQDFGLRLMSRSLALLKRSALRGLVLGWAAAARGFGARAVQHGCASHLLRSALVTGLCRQLSWCVRQWQSSAELAQQLAFHEGELDELTITLSQSFGASLLARMFQRQAQRHMYIAFERWAAI
eukprot:TRINITY_DN28935_c0_g1_i1.p1 TRINITY_DN28935_c0_g1~~TRINITY_DN28935_c0_g1_i1.p1  ORF type:complete len:211 (+),score=39.75 TRINITY_DN28935_c0_g1_i1:238-870(+)